MSVSEGLFPYGESRVTEAAPGTLPLVENSVSLAGREEASVL